MGLFDILILQINKIKFGSYCKGERIMRTKLRSKKGVTLTEVIITLVVSSIFFVMVGSIIVAYRNVTNTAINTTSATSAATLVSNSFEKMTNFCNSSEDNHLYYKRNPDDTFVFSLYQV